MTGLLIKDLRLFKHQGRYYLVVIALCCVLQFFSTRDFSSFMTSYLSFMIVMYTFSSFSYDEYDNGMSFLMTLPCGRRAYVTEKYIFTVLLVTAGWVVGVVLRAAGYMSRFSMEGYRKILVEDPIYLLLVLIYAGCSIPALIWFGAEKGRTAMLLGVGILAFLVYAVMKSGIRIPLADMTPGLLLMVLLILCILVLGISYRVSVCLMEKKEF